MHEVEVIDPETGDVVSARWFEDTATARVWVEGRQEHCELVGVPVPEFTIDGVTA